MDNINNLNGNEIVFTIPFNQNIDLFQTIEKMLKEINQETNILNGMNDDCLELDIQFDFLNNNQNTNSYNNYNNEYNHSHNHLHNHSHNYYHIYNYFENNDNNDYQNNNYDFDLDHFNYCYEIDNKINKSEKIKKDDKILLEQCFICMEEYKLNQFKRLLPNCKHYFHKKCIDKWLKKKASCPICRDDLLK
jgi:hypothetical protein